MNDLELKAEYRRLADSGSNFQGLTVVQYSRSIGKLIRRTKAKTILDYGSGRGDAYADPHSLHYYWNVPVPTLYDPAFEHCIKPPARTRFDGVLCCDVLEHVHIDSIDELLQELNSYATRFVWASVCCRASKKWFGDGTNMHCTIRSYEWWINKMKEHMTVEFQLKETR